MFSISTFYVKKSSKREIKRLQIYNFLELLEVGISKKFVASQSTHL